MLGEIFGLSAGLGMAELVLFRFLESRALSQCGLLALARRVGEARAERGLPLTIDQPGSPRSKPRVVIRGVC